MKAHPGPMVSGSHFLPKAPLLWVKWIPAWEVMSRNWICCAEQRGFNHREMQAQKRIMKEDVRSAHCLFDSVANLFFEKAIYREAPAEIAAGLCPAGRPMAAVPTLDVV